MNEIISNIQWEVILSNKNILQKDIKIKETEFFVNFRANSEENICKLNCLLALESWHLVFGANDVNDSYNILLTFL